MLFILIVTQIIFSVNAGNFNVTFINTEIKSINDGSFMPYCVKNNFTANPVCVDNIAICFQKNCLKSRDGTFIHVPILIYGKQTKIVSNLSLSENGNILPVEFDPIDLNSITDKPLYMTNPKHNFSFMLQFSVKCQKDYLSPNCSEIDFCEKLKSTLCKNNGKCIQNNTKISCECPTEYTGDFCENEKDSCQNNSCINNSTCQISPDGKLKYKCICPINFQGKFCHEDVNECFDTSFCPPNATCINYYGGYNCSSEKQSQAAISTSPPSLELSTTQIANFIKWDLPDFATLLIVSIEAAIIIILILVLIFVQIKNCPSKKKKSKFLVDDSSLFIKDKKKNDYDMNFGRSHLLSEDRHQSIVPMFDIHELENTFNNNLSNNSPGMSTFGRR